MWKKEFVVQKGAIPNIMCDQLVEQYKQLPAGNATVGSDERVDEKIRSSKIRWIHDSAEHEAIFNLVWR